MILFTISFILIFTSSYFISSILAKKNAVLGFIFTLLLAFAHIILTSEILSPFYQIKELPFLLINFLCLIISTVFWIKKGRPTWNFELNHFIKKFFHALNLDKSLWFLFLSWTVFILVSLYLIIILPPTSADASCYHVVRSVDWVINHSLSHFDTADIRINTFPINSEILYLWIILFTKKQLLFGIFSFIGYVLALICGYNIFRTLGYSLRQTIWTLGIISSFASVVVMISGTETDLIIAGLILTSIYLFLDAIKNKSNNSTLFMSALAYAIAIGVKTPAIICIPGVGLLYLLLSMKYHDKKSLLKFIGFGIINLILFSAFNYVQNFLNYGHIAGEIGSVVAHRNNWGIKGMFSGFIKHLFLLIDFSGIRIPYSLGDALFQFERMVLSFLRVDGVPNGTYCGTAFFNFTLIEPYMGCGILSFLLILPCILIALIKPIFCKDKKTIIEFVFASMFIINLLVLSASIAFMTFNTRFITSFIIISLPMIAISYIKSNKNPIKILYLLIAIFYFLVISTHLWGRPFIKMVKDQIHNQLTIREFRSDVVCIKYDKREKSLSEWCNVNALISSKFSQKNYKILVLATYSEEILSMKMLKLQGKNYNFMNMENLKDINPDIYDIIIMPKNGQAITNFEKFTPDKIDYFLTKEYHFPLNPEAEISCYYNSINGTLSKELGTDKFIPYQKVCKLTNNFFKNHPFEFGYKTKEHYFLLNKNTFKN